MKSVGFLGLGIMGTPMALNLLRAGYDVTVWNRSQKKAKEIEAEGAKVAKSPALVVSKCDVTLAMVSDPAAARAIVFGEDGALSAINAGKDYIDLSTVDAKTSIEIGRAIRERGGRFLEAPVSGSKKPAEEGTLILLAAGDKDLYDEALPIMEKVGKMSVYLGENGNGAKMKLIVNMVMGSMLNAFCEGLALAGECGLDGATLLKVLDGGAMANPMFRLKGPNMLSGEFPTAFPLKHMQKDMRLALALGDEVEQKLPVAAASDQNFIEARRCGESDSDFSAVMKVFGK